MLLYCSRLARVLRTAKDKALHNQHIKSWKRDRPVFGFFLRFLTRKPWRDSLLENFVKVCNEPVTLRLDSGPGNRQ